MEEGKERRWKGLRKKKLEGERKRKTGKVKRWKKVGGEG